MRYIAGFLAFVTLLALGLLAFVWYGAHLTVSETSVSVYNASEQRENYERVRQAIEEGSFTGTILQDASYRMPETYDFVVYNVRLHNNGWLPAEWIQMRIVPDGADILAFEEERGFSLAAHSAGTLSMTMMAYAGTTTERTAVVTYYVFGKPFKINVAVQ